MTINRSRTNLPYLFQIHFPVITDSLIPENVNSTNFAVQYSTGYYKIYNETYIFFNMLSILI